MCEEKLRLTREYEAAVDGYLEAMRTLKAKSGTSLRAEYINLLGQAEYTRLQSEAARRALVDHLHSHPGCD